MTPPIALMAQAVMIPSGVPPVPTSRSTPVSGRAATMAPATSPSLMNLMRAPASRISCTRAAWRGRSSTQTVTSLLLMPLALATRAMFLDTGRRMSTWSAASGPATSFSM